MKNLNRAVSIVALSLLLSPSLAGAESGNAQVVPPGAAQDDITELQQIMAVNRKVEDLNDKELQAYYRLFRRAVKTGGLPPDIQTPALAYYEKLRNEGQRRIAAAKAATEPDQREDGSPPAKPRKTAGEQPIDAPIALPGRVRALLADNRDLDTIPAPELSVRVKEAFVLSKDESLPRNVRQRLAGMSAADRKELQRRQQVQAQVEKPKVEQPVENADAPPALPREIRALLADNRDLDTIPAPELTARARRAANLSQSAELPRAIRRELAQRAEADANELRRRKVTKDTAEVDNGNVIEVEPPKPAKPREIIVEGSGNIDPRAEREARRLLTDGVRVEGLDGQNLRARLDRMRELLADGNLDPRTSRELRRRVLAEREVLRARIAFEEAEAEQATGVKPKPRVDASPGGSSGNGRIRIILGDRRVGDELSDEELNSRIRVYRDIEQDNEYLRYDPEDRVRWRRVLLSDRETLRRRLLREREARSGELTIDLNRGKLDVELGINVPPVDRRDVFVAEADEDEIEEILVAPPSARPTRRYTVEEIADAPEVRRSLPRLEIDNVRFGFNEAFVREEEIGNLDRIAAVMERILKKYPREIFMIEGHTDAVGSDIYNLGLSRARADAIKRALSTYYVIPPQNLRTVGLGERYLKVPTPEAEPENRRVSISRVTNYLSSAE